MTYFQPIEGDAAILSIRGVYKQAKLYTMDGHLFAEASGGFVRLAADGSTSKEHMRIVKLVTDIELFKDPLGRLSVFRGSKNKPLIADDRQKLLGGPDGG